MSSLFCDTKMFPRPIHPISVDEIRIRVPVSAQTLIWFPARNGSFKVKEVAGLAIVLRAGSLPAPVKIVQNVSLNLGMTINLFTSLMATKVVFDSILSRFQAKKLSIQEATMELISKTRIDFIGKRKVTFIISSIIAIVGIIGIIQIARNSANMGIDFTGGTSLQLNFTKPVSMEKARIILAQNNLKEATLQEIGEGNKLLIKIGKTTLATGNVAETITDVFKKELPGNAFVVESSTEIGPSIGDKLKKDTLVAVIVSMLGIIIYVAWRFDLKFGIGAIIATLHDVLAMFAVFYVTNKEINLLFITAVLTIAGYSLTDTVVVFDRIRENQNKNLNESKTNVFNTSINEVLSRTVITSLTTFLAAMSLFLFGGEVIHDFAFALVAGVVVATYSSIFIASPIVLELESRTGKIKVQEEIKQGNCSSE